MTCAITIEQQLKFHKKVFSDIRELSIKGELFVIKDYISSIYDLINTKTKDSNLALSYVQLLPTVITQATAFNKDLKKYIAPLYQDIINLEESFEDFNNVSSYINPSVPAEQINEIKEDIKKEDILVSEGKVQPLSEEQVEEIIRKINDPIQNFKAKPSTALGSTGQQALKINGQLSNVKNPEEDFYYDFLSVLDESRILSGDVSSSELTINNHTGFKLRIAPANSISNDKLRPETQRLISGNIEGVSQQEGENLHNQGIAIIISDNDNNPLYFDNSYNVVSEQEGKPIYFNIRSPKLNANGRYTVAINLNDIGGLQTPEELAKSKMTVKAWKDLLPDIKSAMIELEDSQQQAQLDVLYKIRQYINSSGEALESDITGINRGLVDIRFEANTPLSTIDFENSDVKFTPEVASRNDNELGEVVGQLYIRRPSGRSIPIKSTGFTDQQVESIVSLIFDDIKVKTFEGLVSISPEERLRLVNTIVYTNSNGLQLSIRKDKDGISTLFAKVKSNYLDMSNIEGSKQLVRDQLKEPYITLGERALAKKQNRLPKPSGNIKTTSANINFRGDLLNTNIIPLFNIKDNILTITNSSMTEFIKKYGTLGVNLNEQNRIVALNGYMTFSLPDKELSKLGINKASVVEPTTNKFQPNTNFDVVRTPLVLEEVIEEPLNTEIPKKLIIVNSEQTVRNFYADYKGGELVYIKEDEAIYKIDKSSGSLNLITIKDGLETSKEAQEFLDNSSEINSISNSESPEDNRSLEDKLNDLELDKGILVSNNATPKQISEAKEWYDSSPLSKYFPYQQLFDVVNSNVFATWTQHGIRLYAGANYTDLYHESWHGFSQMFLTKEEKTKLYNEVKKQSGSFKDYNGKNIAFTNASNLQVEELLAEDFRKYVLSEGKKISKSTAKNSLFRRILNFLSNLFKGVSYSDAQFNSSSIKSVKDLYDKLYIGDLNQYNPSITNADFGLLNKGIKSVDPLTSINLNYQESALVVKTLDAMISKFIDERNELAGNTKWTSAIFRQPEAVLPLIYESVKVRLEEMRDDFTSKMSENPSPMIESNIRILNEVLTNFGDITQSLTGNQNTGVIAYHLEKSKHLNFDPKVIDAELIGTITAEDVEATRFDRKGNELSALDIASNELVFIMKSITSESTNRLGINELTDFKKLWAKTINTIKDSRSQQEIYDKLLHESLTYKPFGEVLKKLGNPNSQDKSSFNLWIKMYQLALANIPIKQLSVIQNISTEVDDISNEEVITDTNFSVTYGQASAVFRTVESNFKSYFNTVRNAPFVKVTNSGNLLDTIGLINKYDNNLVNKEFEFLRDLGLPLVDTREIRKDIKDNVNVGFLFDKIKKLNDLKVPIFDPIKVLRDKQSIQVNDNLIVLKSESTNVNSILESQVKYSGLYGNVAVNNAKGNAQYETSLQSSLSIMAREFNNTSSFEELVSLPHMDHLKLSRNPASQYSIWLNSLYDMSSPGRPKRKGAEFNLSNLGGIQSQTNNTANYELSTDASSADKYSKMLLDIYSLIHSGHPAVMTHADKGTVLSMGVNKVINSVSTGGTHYVDIEDFLVKSPVTGMTNGINNASRLMIPYIQVEIDRINRIKSGTEVSVPGYTTPDKSGITRGLEFTIFDDILSVEDKSKLLNISGRLENYFNNPTEESIELYNSIKNSINIHFARSKADMLLQLDGMLYLDSNIKERITSPLRSKYNIETKPTNKEIEDGILDAYIVNSFIHNIESLFVVYGDLALYNMAKEEFHKRNAAIASTGNMLSTSQTSINYVNNTLGRGYRKSKQLSERNFNGSFNSVIFRENTRQSVLLDDYRQALIKSIKQKYPKMSDQEIYDKADSILNPYKGMDEGDAQGWITFDAYRIASELEGKWSPKQEKIYQKIITGEEVLTDEIVETFPPKKYQYFGPLSTTGLPITGFHKFSLFPLVPSVIKGTNMEVLHNELEKNEVDYALFQSGSKVGTVVNSETNKPDILYSDPITRTVATDQQYTKNVVRLEYMKNQLDVAPKYKGKVIFSTQLRKLIEEGLVERGVPIDFKPELSIDKRVVQWESLQGSDTQSTEELRMKASPIYTKYKTYENNISRLIEAKKIELIKEAGWDYDDKGNPVGDVSKLLELVKSEMSRQDLGDNEIDFLDVNPDGTLRNDLSLSLSGDKIERVLTAIVNNRLIRQKVNGEGLIQLSGSLLEATNPSELDKSKWGTGDLRSYRQDPVTGITLPMEAKIAIQGKFKFLLGLRHMDGRRVNTVERLNELIQDPEWRSNSNNLKMITMVAVRIPVQGLNSMEFMEVKQFLPIEAGHVIVPPSEIVAKSGSDFDIDKLVVMMPNIAMVNGSPELYQDMTVYASEDELKQERIEVRKEIKEIKDRYSDIFKSRESGDFKFTDEERTQLSELKREYNGRKNKIDGVINILNKEYVDLYRGEKSYFTIQRMNELENLINTYELERDNISNDEYQALLSVIRDQQNEKVGSQREIELSSKELKLSELERQINSFKTGAIENEIMFNIKSILEMSENFVSLITPNDTNLVMPLANKLKSLRDYDSTRGTGKVSPTRVLEPAYNIYKHESNSVGKQTLGLGAIDNNYNTIFNRVGAYMNPEWTNNKNKQQRAQLFLPYNKFQINKGKYKGQEGISLSDLYDTENNNKIADVINQLMNGWVDVAKDAWIFDIQGNKEVTPTLLFLIQAGVPLRTAVYFVSNRLVREYVNEKRKSNSTFSSPLYKVNTNQVKAKMINKYTGLGSHDDDGRLILSNAAIYEETINRVNDSTYKQLFSQEQLEKNTTVISDKSISAFMHFLEIEELANGPSELKMKLNPDTKKSTTLFDAQRFESNLVDLSNNTKMAEDVVSKILDESPIGSFRIQPFQLSLWKELFPLKLHNSLNKFLINKLSDPVSKKEMKNTFGKEDVFINQFRNDFPVALLLNEIKNFDINNNNYRGIELNKDVNIQAIKHSSRGAIISEVKGKPVINIDPEVLDIQFSKNLFSDKPVTSLKRLNIIKTNKFSYSAQGLAPVDASAFMNNKAEYYNFVIEREYIRYNNPISQVVDNKEFINILAENKKNSPIKVVGETTETALDYDTRMLEETYEAYIRDTALDNIFNFWKIFRSKNNVADEFVKIKEEYPELTNNYSLIDNLIVSSAAGISNLKLRDSKMTSDDVNTYHENILALADKSIQKVPVKDKASKIENDRISEFFERLPLVSLFQSGLNSSDSLSIGRFMPQDKITNLFKSLEAKINILLDNPSTSDSFMNRYYNRFIEHNNPKTNISGRRRIKNYVNIKANLSSDKLGLYTTNTNNIFNFREYSKENLESLIELNVGTTFILDKPANENSGYYHERGNIRNIDNVIGVVTMDKIAPGKNSKWTDETYDKNIVKIDESLEKINEIYQTNNSLAFSSFGYGQYMLEPKDESEVHLIAPKTFSYLSKRLYEIFNYINPGAKLVTEVQQIINREQEQDELINISDDKLKENMRSEIYDILFNKDKNCKV